MMKRSENNQYSKVTTEVFIEQARLVHGNKYDYSLVNYVNSKVKVPIVCPEHGIFYQTPNHHKRNRACPKCANHTRCRFPRQTTEEFIEKAKEIHGDKYTYDKVNYHNNHSNVTITCSVHGDFEQSPANHKAGQGCPACKVTGYKTNLPGILYYIRIKKQYYKIGITNRSVEERYSNTDLENIEILQVWKYKDGQECYDKEQEIIKANKHLIYTGPDLLESVKNTEVFVENVLNIDNTKSGSGK